MKIKLFIISLILLISPVLVLAQETTEAAASAEEESIYAEEPIYELEVPIGRVTKVTGAPEYIEIIYTFGISVTGLLAAIMIMLAGFQWIMAGGNEKIISSAKERITSAIIGLVLALASYLILYTINPALVNLPRMLIEKIVPISDGSTSEYSVDDCSLDGENLNESGFTQMANSYCTFMDRTDASADADDVVKHPYQNYTGGTEKQGNGLSPQLLVTAINRYNDKVSPVFMLAQLEQETRFCSNSVSTVGACGVAQFMVSSARVYDSKCGSQLPSDDAEACKYLMNNPEYSICLQGAYLNKMYDQYNGDEVRMAAGYNAGEGRNVMSSSCPGLLVWQCEADFSTDETRNYVAGIAQRKNQWCSSLGGSVGQKSIGCSDSDKPSRCASQMESPCCDTSSGTWSCATTCN